MPPSDATVQSIPFAEFAQYMIRLLPCHTFRAAKNHPSLLRPSSSQLKYAPPSPELSAVTGADHVAPPSVERMKYNCCAPQQFVATPYTIPNSPAAPPAATPSPASDPLAGGATASSAPENVPPPSALVRTITLLLVRHATSSAPPLPASPKSTIPVSSSGYANASHALPAGLRAMDSTPYECAPIRSSPSTHTRVLPYPLPGYAETSPVSAGADQNSGPLW